MAMRLTDEQLDRLRQRVPTRRWAPRVGDRRCADAMRCAAASRLWITGPSARSCGVDSAPRAPFTDGSPVGSEPVCLRRSCATRDGWLAPELLPTVHPLWKSSMLFQGFLHLNCSMMLIWQVLG